MPSSSYDLSIVSNGLKKENSNNGMVGKPIEKSAIARSNPSKISSKHFTSFDEEEELLKCTIHDAARENQVEYFKQYLLKTDTSISSVINELDYDGQAAIHLASRYNSTDFIRYIVQEGVDIDLPGEDGNTALHVAIKYDCDNAAIVLLKLGANRTIENCYGQTPLHFAARRSNLKICQILLSTRTIDVNKTDNGQSTPLHMAVNGGNAEVVELLIHRTAKVDVADIEGQHPLHIAAFEGHAKLLPILINHGTINAINIKTRENKSPLHLAAQGGHAAAVKALLSLKADVNSRTNNNSTPLHFAVVSDDTLVIEHLINHGARINAKDDKQSTPLHRASLSGKVTAMKILLSHGANINIRDIDQLTPLLCAVWRGQTDAAAFLLKHNANIKITDRFMRNILHIAVQENQLQTLQMLLNNGANVLVNIPDKDFQTSLHYASRSGNIKIIAALLKSKARIYVRDNREQTAVHLVAASGKGKAMDMLGKVAPGIINVTDDHGKSPLHIAAINGFLTVAAKLMSLGAEIGLKDDNGMTALDYTAAKGHSKVLKLLIDNHAPLESTNKNSQTGLHHAASNGHVECVTILLDSGANITATDINGNNCLQVASENNNVDVCLALVKHKRWRDVLKETANQDTPPMAYLIEFLPEVAEAVLDNCMESSKHSKEHKDYSVTYNFEYLDILPCEREQTEREGRSYFAPHYMAKYSREKLLSHPVTLELVDHKWNAVGKQFYFVALFVYIVFVALLNTMILRESSPEDDSKDYHCETFAIVISGICLGLAVLQSIKELLQMITLRLEYFFNPENYIEVPLCITAVIYTITYLFKHTSCSTSEVSRVEWEAGVIAVFLSWANLLLYLKRIPFFGLVVVMFVEVLRTIIGVILVFSIVLMGFTIAFHVLLKQIPVFSEIRYAFVKVLVMMTGEFDFGGTISDFEHVMHFQEITILLFVMFLLLLHVVMMNLMVGLAVGEITKVKESAKLTMLKNEVELIRDVASRYPKWYLKKIHQTKITVYPNRMNVWQRILQWLGNFNHKSLALNPTTQGEDEYRIHRDIEIKFEKQKKRMKKLQEVNEEQNKLIRQILQQKAI